MKRPPYAAVVAVRAATVASLVAAVPAVSVTAAEVRMERTVKTACCDLLMTMLGRFLNVADPNEYEEVAKEDRYL